MVNITHKNSTLRIAIAQAIVQLSSEDAMQMLLQKKVPKGDVFEMAKTAGLFAAKRTADMIPDCHPLPIEYAQIRFKTVGLVVFIEAEIHTVYKTGVEVEAMHAASVVALTMYDMLKPLDKNIEITHIKLIDKRGGKSDFTKKQSSGITAAVIVCSDSISAGKKEDFAGKAIIEKLKQIEVAIDDYCIIPDEKNTISDTLQHYVQKQVPLIIFTGGTGFSPRDVTPEAIIPLLQKRIPGIEEAIRSYGQQRTPYAMFSRSVVGLINKSLVMALPGSTRGAAESMDAIFPFILHLFRVMEGARHDS